MYIIRTKIPCLVWVTFTSRKLSCHEVYDKIGMHQRRKVVLMNSQISLSCLDVWIWHILEEKQRKEIELNRKRYHYFGVKYIVFKSVGSLIYLTWLFESVVKRVISSYVLILCFCCCYFCCRCMHLYEEERDG